MSALPQRTGPVAASDWLRVAAVVLTVFVLNYLAFVRLPTSPYDLAMSAPLAMLLDLMMQLSGWVAMLGALCIAGCIDRQISRHCTPAQPLRLFSYLLAAALCMTATFWLCSYLAMRAVSSQAAPASASWIWSGYAFDLFTLMLFAQFIHALTRRWYWSLLIFALYVCFIVGVGARWADIELIGFATTPPVTLSGYSSVPVGTEAAWLTRLYWGSIAIMLTLLLTFFDRRPQPLLAWHQPANPAFARTGAACISVVAGVAILTALTIDAGKATVALRYPAGTDVLPHGAEALAARASVTSFSISIDAPARVRSVAVQGTLQLTNRTGQPLRDIALEKAQLLHIGKLTTDRSAKVFSGPAGRLLLLQLQQPLAPGDQLQVHYQGQIKAQDIFDKQARTAVMDEAFFLTSAAVLPLPKNSACFAASMDKKRCDAGENYLQSDAASGRVLVTVPAGLQVAAARKVASSGGRDQYELAVPSKALSHFLVAAAKFRHSTTSGEHPVEIFSAPDGHSPAGQIAAYVAGEIGFYAANWQPLTTDSYWLVETPANFIQAVAYFGGAAISETVLSIRASDATTPAAASKMVLSHELAHQWWGFTLVPAKGPGDAFVLESVAQFSATDRLRAQGLLSRAQIIATEQNNVQRALAAGSATSTPLRLIRQPGWQAYHAGPWLLAQLDDDEHGQLMSAFARTLAQCAPAAGQRVDPQHVIETFIHSFQPPQRPMIERQFASAYPGGPTQTPGTASADVCGKAN